MKRLERLFVYVAYVLALCYGVAFAAALVVQPDPIARDVLWLTAMVWFLLARDAQEVAR